MPYFVRTLPELKGTFGYPFASAFLGPLASIKLDKVPVTNMTIELQSEHD